MMVAMYVRARNGAARLGRRLQEEQKGMTMIEYGVAAAFLVLALVGAALIVGPELTTWLTTTIRNIINGRV